jgi:hypothetical protein
MTSELITECYGGLRDIRGRARVKDVLSDGYLLKPAQREVSFAIAGEYRDSSEICIVGARE